MWDTANYYAFGGVLIIKVNLIDEIIKNKVDEKNLYK